MHLTPKKHLAMVVERASLVTTPVLKLNLHALLAAVRSTVAFQSSSRHCLIGLFLDGHFRKGPLLDWPLRALREIIVQQQKDALACRC